MLSISSRQKLIDLLTQEEGYRQFPYKDTMGILTIGIGRNLRDNGISHDEAIYLLNNDITSVECELLINCPWSNGLDPVRYIVLLDMGFNLGIPKLMLFKKFLRYMQAHQFQQASLEMLDSLWAKQVGNRAQRLSHMVETGVMA